MLIPVHKKKEAPLMDKECITPAELRAYEKLPVPFCIFRIIGKSCELKLVSDGLCSAFNTERSEFSKPCHEILEQFICPDDLKHLYTDFESACLDPKGQYSAVYRIRTPDNEPYHWIRVKGNVIREYDGSYLLYTYWSDIQDETDLHHEESSEKIRQDILLSEILSTTKTAIFWKDADRRFLGANKAFLEYYGFSDLNEILGKNDEEMGWHTDPDPYKNDEIRVLRDGISTYRVPGRCIARGVDRNIVASKSPLIVNGKIVGLVGSFEDVTKETRQRDEISRLNAELKKRISDRDILMSISEVCIVKIDLRDYTILEYNDTMCRLEGLKQEDYDKQYHRDLDTFFGGKFRTELDNLKKEASRAIAAGEKRIDLNMRIPTARGFVWIGGSASFTDYDSTTKRPSAMYAVYRDITDVIEAQKKLELAEIEIQKSLLMEEQISRMRSLINGVPSGIGALRITNGVPDHTMQLNLYFAERVDIAANKDNVADLNAFLDALHPDDRSLLDKDYHDFLHTKKLTVRQYRFRNKSRDYVWISVRGTFSRISEDTEIAYFVYTNINEIKIAEAKLKENQRFYQAVVQAAKLSTWVYDINSHTIVMSDDPHTKITSDMLSIPHVIKNVPDALVPLISEEDRPAFLEMYRKVDMGQDASCETWFKPENGRVPRCERLTYIASSNPGGRNHTAIGFSQNITADRKVEERYQRELGYLRQTDDNNLGAKGHYNLTKNVVLEYITKNDSFFKVQPGTTYDEALRLFSELPYSDKERREIMDKMDRFNLISRYQQGQMQTSLLYSRPRKGALPFWVSLNIHTYMSPETGDLEAFTYAYDVTDKMETDDIIGLISEVQFDYIGLIYAETDEFELIKKAANITYGNVGERMRYSDACSYVGSEFLGEDERKQYWSAISLECILSGLESNGGRYTTTYHRNENGRVRSKQVDYIWLSKQEKIILAVRSDTTASFERDQEQLAKIEAAKLEADRANEAKSTFLSSMSHDLRTPLNGVLGFTEIALKEQDPQKKQEYLKKIEASGRLLLDLVNDTLELSRIESGKAALNEEAFLSDELIPAIITALRPSAELKGIHLISDLDEDTSVIIWCDKLKCQKIVLNLISNAIKYTPEGGTVSVSLKPIPNDVPGCRLSLVVEDNGIGMSEEFMKRMYEPFSQEKRSESQKVPGTGLGLSIVKRYVDMMGGKIQVESRLHKGTRWVVSLPIHRVDEGLSGSLKDAVSEGSLSGLHVLLCEDNYMNTEIASMLLKEKGISVTVAENGEAGLKQFADSETGFFDFILMDIRMPVMDGYTAARKIRALNRSDASLVPIIAMTADAFEESIREAKEAGMDDYVTKPLDPQKMFEVLRALKNGRTAAGKGMDN
jgi:PAS domain S-box-containing protein